MAAALEVLRPVDTPAPIITVGRDRRTVDERHRIRDPMSGNLADARAWENTLLKTRVSTLCLTEAGFQGHLDRLQGEINRCDPRFCEEKSPRYRAVSPAVFVELVEINERIYSSVIKCIKEHGRGMKLEGQLTFPMLSGRTIVVSGLCKGKNSL